jgi:protein-S-isoprenylcysteine O-methyltransferase Ste14
LAHPAGPHLPDRDRPLSIPRIPLPWLYQQLWPGGLWPFWIGAAVTVAGLLFAVWARRHLGRNWSNAVTITQGHELITTGPYALIRHPIYTGILTGFLGTTIALSEVRGVIGFVLIFVVLCAKLRTEEEWMRSQFGETYATYVHHTAALVPYILRDAPSGILSDIEIQQPSFWATANSVAFIDLPIPPT